MVRNGVTLTLVGNFAPSIPPPPAQFPLVKYWPPWPTLFFLKKKKGIGILPGTSK